jgi:hypothetical protein
MQVLVLALVFTFGLCLGLIAAFYYREKNKRLRRELEIAEWVAKLMERRAKFGEQAAVNLLEKYIKSIGEEERLRDEKLQAWGILDRPSDKTPG